MANAAERLLGFKIPEIEKLAEEIILGQLRLTVASLTIEQINQDRDAFLSLITQNVDQELRKFGLTQLNVNIVDITDESDYIESIGKKAAATAVENARVDVANAERDGAIGAAIASKEREITVERIWPLLRKEGRPLKRISVFSWNSKRQWQFLGRMPLKQK